MRNYSDKLANIGADLMSDIDRVAKEKNGFNIRFKPEEELYIGIAEDEKIVSITDTHFTTEGYETYTRELSSLSIEDLAYIYDTFISKL
jgi:hypothetical protein